MPRCSQNVGRDCLTQKQLSASQLGRRRHRWRLYCARKQSTSSRLSHGGPQSRNASKTASPYPAPASSRGGFVALASSPGLRSPAPSPRFAVDKFIESSPPPALTIDEAADDGGEGAFGRSASEMAAALERLGVAPSVVRGGASLSGLRALEQAAKLRHALVAHSAPLRSRPGARQSLSGGRLGGGGDAEVADAALVDALEEQLVEVLGSCGECVGLLVGELERAHRLALREGGPRARRSLLDERARAVRRSKRR